MQSLLGVSEFGSVHHFCICLRRLSHDKIHFLKIKLFSHLCNRDWTVGWYFLSQNEDQSYNQIFLLRKGTFSHVPQRVI